MHGTIQHNYMHLHLLSARLTSIYGLHLCELLWITPRASERLNLEKYVGLLQNHIDWNMASATSNTPMDSNMFDDPPAEHAERYAIHVAPAPALTPGEVRVVSRALRPQIGMIRCENGDSES
eukprot:5525466-Amphidinium_carterae.2